ncbi:MAG: hypothetical protein U0804_12220 [Gemmataceae bacterium]
MALTPREIYEREYAREQARLDARDAHQARRAAAFHAAGFERGRRQYQGCALGCAGAALCALFLLGCWLLGAWLEQPPLR